MYTFGLLRLRLSKHPAGAGVDSVLLDSYINARYREYLDKYPFTRLVKTSTIQTGAVYDTGSISILSGATSGTSSGTVFTSQMTGRRFRAEGRSEIYVFTYVSATSFTIDRAYEGDDLSGAGYRIFQPYYALPSDLRVLESVSVPFANRDLDQIERERLDWMAPTRELFGEPEMYAPYDDSSTPLPQIELYPIPLRAEGLPIRYSTAKARLAATSDVLPDWMSEECLITGVEADLYGLQGDAGMMQAKEAKFQELLNDQVKVDVQRQVSEQMRMANRFTQHRRARALRNDDDDELAILRRS